MSESVWPVRCAWCERVSFKPMRDVNRAEARGAPLYCNRECAGLGRRKHKTPEQLKLEKAEYDRARRAALGEKLLAEKRAAYHAAVAANPDLIRTKQREHRRKRKSHHAEYCRRPEYKKWKVQYDRQYRAHKDFGPYAEAALILTDIETEINARSTFTERAVAKGTLNKRTQRRRDYEQAIGR